MSRNIDLTKPLSPEDEQYLRDRDRFRDIELAKANTAKASAPADSDSPSPVGDELPDDYNDWTKDQLTEELKARQLAVSGNKDELVARLVADDEEHPEEQEQAQQ
jgi:hypothetical protein